MPAAVQDELQRSFRKRLLLACEKTAEECKQVQSQSRQQQQQQQQQHQQQQQQQQQDEQKQKQQLHLPPYDLPAHKPLIFARHPHVAGGSDLHDDHVHSAPVLDLPKAAHVQLQHVPVAEHSWRGRDVDKSSAAFAVATQMIARAQKLCFEASLPVSGIQSITKFFYDNSIKLLGSNPSSVAADLDSLSRECTRLFSRQPMVIKAHGDTKVFGDIRTRPPTPSIHDVKTKTCSKYRWPVI
jgi:hypothetical protein